MSLLIPCPICGARDVDEFAYAGEVLRRPSQTPSLRELASYLYFRDSVAGVQREWWYHRLGCERWFLAERDTGRRAGDVAENFASKIGSNNEAGSLGIATPFGLGSVRSWRIGYG
jgi:heterotetrameric sarcosine oxidase delta subunit